jgi:hypothetical protein
MPPVGFTPVILASERLQTHALDLTATGNGKDKVNFPGRTGHERQKGEEMYSSTLSLTSSLHGVGGQRHAPSALPPGKTRYALYTRLGGHQGRSGRVRNISPPPGFDPRTLQPVASHYNGSANPPPARPLVSV